MLNKGALLKLGWTPALIAAVLGKPDRVQEHRKGYKHWVEHLYCEARVKLGMSDPRFMEAARRRRARAIAADKRREEIPTRYPSWRDALGEASAGLFSLNRYAKHRTCSEVQKVEIYQLKNEFIQLLYERGFCTLSWIHRLELPEQICRDCGGDGEYCDHCDGSGIWRPARVVEFWCFRFVIADKTFCWHQPVNLVEFTPVENLPPQEWEGLIREKPVALPRRKFALVKDLLRWVIDAAAGEGAETPVDCSGRFEPISLSAGEQSHLFPA